MEGYNTEEETLAAFRNWWNKNSKYIVAGLVIAALVIGSWRLWGYWQAKRAAAGAALYAAVVQAEQQNNNPAIVKAAQAVISAYPDSAYGALAGLALAKAELVQQDLKDAANALQQVMQNSPDKGLAAVARLRLARVQIQSGNPNAALATLQGQSKSGPFISAIDSIRGDAFSALGKPEEARRAYRKALAQASASSGQYQMLQMRLASLPAGTAAAAAQASTAGKPASAQAVASTAHAATAGGHRP